MFLQRLIHSDLGQYAISIILGLGLASLFRSACTGKNCYEFVGPSDEEIGSNVYQFDDECYRFQSKAMKCDKHKKTLEFQTYETKQEETDTKPKSLLTSLLESKKEAFSQRKEKKKCGVCN